MAFSSSMILWSKFSPRSFVCSNESAALHAVDPLGPTHCSMLDSFISVFLSTRGPFTWRFGDAPRLVPCSFDPMLSILSSSGAFPSTHLQCNSNCSCWSFRVWFSIDKKKTPTPFLPFIYSTTTKLLHSLSIMHWAFLDSFLGVTKRSACDA